MKVNLYLWKSQRGKFGKAVASNWKGIDYVKSMPEQVHNPRTDGQMKQRGKFDIILGYARIFAIFLRVGFKELAIKKSAYNAFQTENLTNDFLTYVTDSWVANEAEMLLAKGSLDVTEPTSVSASASADTATINFSSSAIGNQSLGDKLYVILGNDSSKGTVVGTISRSAGTAVIPIVGGLAGGDSLGGYMFFLSSDGKKVSNSKYITITAS